MGLSIDECYPAREAASSQFVDRAYSRDRGTDDEHAISHGFLFSRTRRRTSSQRLDDEGVSDLSPKRVSSDDGIEIFPDVVDPPVADREAKHIFVAIWPPVRQNHVAPLLDEHPAAITRDGKLHFVRAQAFGAIGGGCHPEIDHFRCPHIAAEPSRLG